MNAKLQKLINKQDKVKEFGQVFTPKILVDEMLSKLPEENFKDPAKTFLDPSCGNGNFLIEILKKKIKKGHMVFQALYTIYGVEIQQELVDECKKRLLDYLLEDIEDFGTSGIKVHNSVLVGTTKETFIRYANRILDHHIKCYNTLEFNFDTWNGAGQISMFPNGIK